MLGICLLPLSLLILQLSSPVHARLIKLHVIFTQQSQKTTFSEWLEFFTLCLAPLVTHLAAGVWRPTLLSSRSKRPGSASLIPHYNPLSILWRYYAIADRRLRARHWDERDMAACNAVFWDGERECWDGSEEIMVRSRGWIQKAPEQSHVPIVSVSCLVTVALMFQGMQAMVMLVQTAISTLPGGFPEGLPYIFLPLALLGLLRLPAALWCTGDYTYMDASEKVDDDKTSFVEETEVVSDRLLDAWSWKGTAYRIWWILSIIGLSGTGVMICSQLWWSWGPSDPPDGYSSLSEVLIDIMFLIGSAGGLLIHCTYVLKGRTDSTVIPCIHSMWYKIFTLLLFALAIASVVVSALETRKLPDGTTTTFPDVVYVN